MSAHTLRPTRPKHRAGRRVEGPLGRRPGRWGVAAGVLAAATVGTVSASPAALAESDSPDASDYPCSASARACVDVARQEAWLIDDDGEVVRGPMRVSTGDRGHPTPTGRFHVYRQDADHVSGETTGPDGRPSRMPYSTFFAAGGVAFHGGDTDRASAGCVHMDADDAEATYDFLGDGDEVQVVDGS